MHELQIHQASELDWQNQFTFNLNAVYSMIQEAARHVSKKRPKDAHIVVVRLPIQALPKLEEGKDNGFT